MKKFFSIRNLLISLVVLIVVIALIYIFVMRSNDIGNSKTSKLYYDLVNRDVVALTLEFKENESEYKIIYSQDRKNNKSTSIVEVHDNSESAKKYNNSTFKSVAINENGKTHVYNINYDLKRYTTQEIEENYDDNRWLTGYLKGPLLAESKYYTKGYEIINSENLFVETFPETQTKYYYKDDTLKYIENNDGSGVNKKRLHKVTIENKFIEESVNDIINGFELTDILNKFTVENLQ